MNQSKKSPKPLLQTLKSSLRLPRALSNPEKRDTPRLRLNDMQLAAISERAKVRGEAERNVLIAAQRAYPYIELDDQVFTRIQEQSKASQKIFEAAIDSAAGVHPLDPIIQSDDNDVFDKKSEEIADKRVQEQLVDVFATNETNTLSFSVDDENERLKEINDRIAAIRAERSETPQMPAQNPTIPTDGVLFDRKGGA